MRHNATEAMETIRTRAGDVAHHHSEYADLTPPLGCRGELVALSAPNGHYFIVRRLCCVPVKLSPRKVLSALPMVRQRRPKDSLNVSMTENALLTPPAEERSQAVTCYVSAGLDKRRHTQRPMEIAPPLAGRSMRLNFRRHFHSCWGFSAVQMSQWQ